MRRRHLEERWRRRIQLWVSASVAHLRATPSVVFARAVEAVVDEDENRADSRVTDRHLYWVTGTHGARSTIGERVRRRAA